MLDGICQEFGTTEVLGILTKVTGLVQMDGALVTVLGQTLGKAVFRVGIFGAVELTTLKVLDMYTLKVLYQVSTTQPPPLHTDG